MRLYSIVAVISVALTRGAYPVLAQQTFNPPLQNFTQKLDHASCDNVTFQQQYQLNTAHFRPGGPILFHQSEELPVAPVEFHVFADYAEELGAIVTTLEHRYFGKSFPDGIDLTSNITKATFAPLTLDNVLQDAVEYVNWIRKTVPGAENSPVIYSGGSYGGFLSVMARVRRPETFHAALAISPLVRGFGSSHTVADNPYKFAANDWVANVYWDANADASHKIKDALNTLSECVKTDSCATLFPDLNPCTPLVSSSDWKVMLYGALLNLYPLAAQFNYAIGSVFPTPLPLDVLINKTLGSSTPGQTIRVPFLVWQGNITNDHDACIDWKSFVSPTGTAQLVGIGASWSYITCTYLSLDEAPVSPNNTLFPPYLVNEPANGCAFPDADWASPDINKTAAEWLDIFHLNDAELDLVERLLIVNGMFDRSTAYALPNLSLSSDRNHIRVLNVEGLAHGDSQYSASVYPRGLRQQLDATRNTQLQYIKEWINFSPPSNGTGTGSKAGRDTGPLVEEYPHSFL